jgi:hypothetical protein
MAAARGEGDTGEGQQGREGEDKGRQGTRAQQLQKGRGQGRGGFFYLFILQYFDPELVSSLPFKCDAPCVDTCSVVLLYLEKCWHFPAYFLHGKGQIARNIVAHK